MRFFDFPDESEKIPAKVHMQLLDLARALTGEPDLQLDFGLHAVYDESRKRLTVSTFWERFDEVARWAGMKSDVYLRAIGSAHFSDAVEIGRYLQRNHPLPSLAKQLFALSEDTRLERVCRALRPGTAGAFDDRHSLYTVYAANRLAFHARHQHLADVLLLALYGRFSATSPEAAQSDALPQGLDFAVGQMDSLASDLQNAQSTADVAALCQRFLDAVADQLPMDVVETYFLTNAYNASRQPTENDGADRFSDMVRTNELDGEASDVTPVADSADVHDEQVEMWHQETQEEAHSALRMNLEHGTSSDHRGDSWREGSDENTVLSDVVQAQSQSSAVQRDAADGATPSARTEAGSHQQSRTGKLMYAKVRHRFLPKPELSAADGAAYQVMANQVALYRLKLTHIIQAHLERKLTHRREGLLAGRLGHKLLRAVVDPTPRLFHKKESPASDLDAVFLLLVDCSGSMFDRMDETRLGVALFHETLKTLRVSHSVIGFWEDTDDLQSDASLTLFQPVIDYDECLKKSSGPAICHLDAHLDNRDGYAIRTMAKQLVVRPERRKILLVFSDGEPAAVNYEDTGVYDTHLAVLEARRQGVQVVHLFFTGSHPSASADTAIHDIYGSYAVTVPQVDSVTDVLAPVLRQLLYSAM